MSDMRYNRVGSKKQYTSSSCSCSCSCSCSSSSPSSSSSSSCHGFRGFRLKPRRFSVQRLRSKLFLMKLFSKLKNSYGNTIRSIRRNLGRRCKKDEGNISRRNLVAAKEEILMQSSRRSLDQQDQCCSRMKSFARTNSFYTEAIADCLDFIKRNSLSLEENPVLNLNQRN